MKARSVWRWIVLGFFVLYMVVPLIATAFFSIATRWDRTILPEGFTLAWWKAVTGRRAFGDTLKNSLQVSFWTALCSAILITPTVYWAHMRVPRAKPVIELLTILPFGIPGVVLALALVRFYSGIPIPLVNRPPILVAACMVIGLPFMYRPVVNALYAIDARALSEAAQSLGAGWWTTLFEVILPNILVGVINGCLMVFSLVFSEFTLANLLLSTRFKTFPIYLVEFTRFDGRQASALAMISFVAAWLVSLIINLLAGRRGRPEEALGGR